MGDFSATVPVHTYHLTSNQRTEEMGPRTLNEGFNTLLMFQRLRLLNQIHFILQNNQMLQLHDLNCSQMLRRLRLRTRLVRGDEKEGGVHDGGTVQHGGHENVVAGTVDEGDMADELHAVAASWSFAGWVVFLVGAVGAVTAWSWAGFVFAFVDLWGADATETESMSGQGFRFTRAPRRVMVVTFCGRVNEDVGRRYALLRWHNQA